MELVIVNGCDIVDVIVSAVSGVDLIPSAVAIEDTIFRILSKK